MELSRRRRLVLKNIVEHYVDHATPVPSSVVAQKVYPRVSPATVRNDMATLERQGFIFHPHTSAGSIPSDLGYRYYVEYLMEGPGLSPAEERTIRHQFHQVPLDVEAWVHLATAVMANLVRSAAMVTPPAPRSARLRRIELVGVGEHMVLLVALLTSGGFRQQVVRVPEPFDRDGLVKLSNKLSDKLGGKSATQLVAAAASFVGWEREVVHTAARLLREADKYRVEDIYYEGLRHIVAQPEFSQSAKLRPVLEALEHRAVLVPLLADALESGQVRIVIGSEHATEEMRGCSVVLSGYGLGGELQGVLGVIGPTRLPYWRAVPLVRFMAGLLSLLLETAYAKSPS